MNNQIYFLVNKKQKLKMTAYREMVPGFAGEIQTKITILILFQNKIFQPPQS